MTDKDNAIIPHRVLPSRVMTSLKKLTDARIALGHAGAGLPTDEVLRFSLDHARARDAISSTLADEDIIKALKDGPWPLSAKSAVTSRQEYLTRPDLGRQISEASHAQITQSGLTCDLCIVVADGLSALAANLNAVACIENLRQQLPSETSVGTVLLHNGRVAAGDQIALALKAKAVLVLIGERPGLSAADSLGAYLTWQPRTDTRDAERFCVSNIRTGGMEIHAASTLIANLLERSRIAGHSGVASITE